MFNNVYCSSEEEAEVKMRKALIGVDEEDGMKKLIESDNEDEDQKSDEEDEEEGKEKFDKAIKKESITTVGAGGDNEKGLYYIVIHMLTLILILHCKMIAFFKIVIS